VASPIRLGESAAWSSEACLARTTCIAIQPVDEAGGRGLNLLLAQERIE
jgi:hypothetical protein